MNLDLLTEDERDELRAILIEQHTQSARAELYKRIHAVVSPKEAEPTAPAADATAPLPLRASTAPAGLGSTSATSSVSRGPVVRR